MNIQIKDRVGFTAVQNMMLMTSLLSNRKPKEGDFNYGFETHGVFGTQFNLELPFPIQVFQSNKRTSEKSPIQITIERHYPIK